MIILIPLGGKKPQPVILSLLLFTKCLFKSHLKHMQEQWSPCHLTNCRCVFHPLLKGNHKTAKRQQVEFLKHCYWISSICIWMDIDVTENSCAYEMDSKSKIMARKGDITPEKLGNFENWSSRNEIQTKKQILN